MSQKKEQRMERRAAALRENLRKRKSQATARAPQSVELKEHKDEQSCP